ADLQGPGLGIRTGLDRFRDAIFQRAVRLHVDEQLSPALAEIEVHLRKVQGRIEHVGGLATLQAGLEMAALDRPFGARRAGEQVVGKGGAHAKRGRATQKIAPAKLSLRDVSAEKFE